jgi:hypothetical protein
VAVLGKPATTRGKNGDLQGKEEKGRDTTEKEGIFCSRKILYFRTV